jgi:hypothetical protein
MNYIVDECIAFIPQETSPWRFAPGSTADVVPCAAEHGARAARGAARAGRGVLRGLDRRAQHAPARGRARREQGDGRVRARAHGDRAQDPPARCVRLCCGYGTRADGRGRLVGREGADPERDLGGPAAAELGLLFQRAELRCVRELDSCGFTWCSISDYVYHAWAVRSDLGATVM